MPVSNNTCLRARGQHDEGKIFTAAAVAVASLAAATALVAYGSNDDPVIPVVPVVVVPATPFTVKLIGFNDFHGTLESPGTFGQNTAIPAASHIATTRLTRSVFSYSTGREIMKPTHTASRAPVH